MDFALPVVLGISLSACTGFRAFLPPFLIGLVQRFLPGWLQAVTGLGFLAQTPVLVALGVAVVVEFLADKIPWLDHLLDFVQLPVKMVLTGVLTFTLLPPAQFSWLVPLLTLVISETTTAAVHTGKAGVRAASTATTGGLLNPVISVVEEVAAVMGTLLAILAPWVAICLFVWVLWRCVRFMCGKVGGNEGVIAQTPPSVWFYRPVSWGLRVFFHWYNSLTVDGTGNIPGAGPYVVVANHASIFDGLILGAVLPHPVFIMVKKEAFENPMMGWLLRRALAFPVDRDKPDPTSIKFCIRVLQEKRVLGLFPEGTRSLDGLIRPFKPGAIRLAIRQKAPLVPLYLYNTHRLSEGGESRMLPVPLRASFGPPLDTAALLQQGMTETQIQDLLFAKVCELGQQVAGRDVRELTNHVAEAEVGTPPPLGEGRQTPSPASVSGSPPLKSAAAPDSSDPGHG